MRYDNEELMRQLGAEYVIGTLRGAARRRFETLMQHDAEARAQVAFWEQRLSEFGQIVGPVTPPAALRAELMRQTDAPAPVLPGVRPARRLRRRYLRWARPYAAGLATAAGLVLAFMLGQRNALAPLPQAPLPPIAASEPQDATGVPIYVAQVGMPASSMRWLLSVSPDHRQLQVTASDDFLQVGRHRLQLWGIVPGAEPVALGTLPLERDAMASFDIPPALQGLADLRFAMTLEGQDSAGLNQPRGPVLSTAAALDAI